MREQGVVAKIISGKIVEVAFQRSEACAKCRACHEVAENMVGIEAIDETGKARQGDIVEIEIPSEAIVKGSIIVFIIPILFLAFGYLVGSGLVSFLGFAGIQEIAGIVLGLILMASSFLLVNLYDRELQRRESLRAKVISLKSPSR